MRVLVTGGSGFIGAALMRHVRQVCPDAFVWSFSRTGGHDIRDAADVMETFQRVEPDVVYHLAANTHVDYSIHGTLAEKHDYWLTNAGGTQNVLDACLKVGCKLVHVSTSEVYGTSQNPGFPMTEEHPVNPQAGTYAVSKAAADHQCRVNHETYGQDVVIVRPFNQVGPGQDARKLFPRFINLALAGQPLTINGDGEQRRDYVHVYDTARALWDARRLEAGTIVNVGTETSYTVNEIADRILVACGDKTMATHEPAPDRPNEVRELNGSYAKLNDLTGWTPSYTLERTVGELVGYMRASLPQPEPVRGAYPGTTVTFKPPRSTWHETMTFGGEAA